MKNFSLEFRMIPATNPDEMFRYLLMAENEADIIPAAENTPVKEYANIIEKFISRFETQEEFSRFFEWMKEKRLPVSHQAMTVALSHENLYTTDYLADLALEQDYGKWLLKKLADVVDAFVETETKETKKSLEYWWKEYDKYLNRTFAPAIDYICWEAKMDQHNIRRRADGYYHYDLDADIPEPETALVPGQKPKTIVCQLF